jgi:GTP-binding protein HflX
LITVRDPIERVLLVAAPRKGSADAAHLQEHLDELQELVDTAGGEVIGRLSQQVESPNPATLIGEGKVEEVRRFVEAEGASLVVFDEELAPVQGANLERAIGVRVMDRAELILDIFSTRARSHEAKLQVELAQLEYLLPRLTRMWTHLSRIRGGIGLRGPGETQLETDRRMIRRKIRHLKGKLAGVEKHRTTVRTGRQTMLTVAIVGYTNAGKSSILQALTGEHDIFVENRLFATLDTLTREVDLRNGLHARLSDTVGFIRKLPHHLVASFRATLEEVREADLLLHVVDVNHHDWEAHVEVVKGVLDELGVGQRPSLMVFNKTDLLPDALDTGTRIRALYPAAVFTTTTRTDGLKSLRDALRERAEETRPAVRILVRATDGARLASIYRGGDVIAREELGEEIALTVRGEPWRIQQLLNDGMIRPDGNGTPVEEGSS